MHIYTMGGGCKNTCTVRWGGEYSRVRFRLGSPSESRGREYSRVRFGLRSPSESRGRGYSRVRFGLGSPLGSRGISQRHARPKAELRYRVHGGHARSVAELMLTGPELVLEDWSYHGVMHVTPCFNK